ncbi:GMC family oxidoreductase [Burkholderia sp. Tr-862]|uniref:GMC family oxidoreductase n=1 Tax=Burkholderia sp. Tr-862 TaxID=2608331 RepID=UPI001419F0C3|nr:GMC family oxidoreductase [Burkholderia sp. Tr-862]NIF40378.1 GMC family oxidoreductase [Burkholderia sp. Tr-862]
MSTSYDFDYIVIGSGFGGSVSACRLTEKGYSVGVMEMGRRWTAEDFPKTNWDARRWMWRPGLKMFGFYNMRLFRHVMVLSGNAVGGGSITYANALLVPPDKVWDEGSWAGLKDWKRIMPQYYAMAERMLGVTENQILGEADFRLKKMADMQGVGDTFHNGRVATFFAPEGEAGGKTYADPYFDGEGPERGTCVGCGGCMVGCKHNAKNTLDKNYLYFAEKRGAQVFAETRVVDVRPLDGKEDGSNGYEVFTERSTTWFNKQRRSFRCRGVVFAASSLGTMELLFRLKQSGSLPRISDDLGKRVRTNAESLVGVRFPAKDKSMSLGVAGGAGVYIDERTHIGAVRYPEGSDATGLMMTLLSGGRAGWTRIFTWLWTLATHPVKAIRVHNPFGFARQTILFVVMQTVDAFINMQFKRRWYWPFGKQLCTEGGPIPTFIPEANNFVEKGAKALGGIPTTLLTEILFNIPTTAHCMGGCAMADSPERGVMDAQNHVFGYQNLLICDGSMLSANLGVNPSLTITALTEHAMSHIPAKSSHAPHRPSVSYDHSAYN